MVQRTLLTIGSTIVAVPFPVWWKKITPASGSTVARSKSQKSKGQLQGL